MTRLSYPQQLFPSMKIDPRWICCVWAVDLVGCSFFLSSWEDCSQPRRYGARVEDVDAFLQDRGRVVQALQYEFGESKMSYTVLSSRR